MEDIIIRYPLYLQEFEEFQELSRLLSPELRKFYEEIKRVSDDRFTKTMSLQAILRWEGILDLTPLAADSLDDRRFRIRVKLDEMLPFTETWLRNQLTSLLGADGFTLLINPIGESIDVKVAVANRSNYDTVANFLERVVPLQMIITLTQLYNTYLDIENSGMSYGDLDAYTYQQIREDIIF